MTNINPPLHAKISNEVGSYCGEIVHTCSPPDAAACCVRRRADAEPGARVPRPRHPPQRQDHNWRDVRGWHRPAAGQQHRRLATPQHVRAHPKPNKTGDGRSVRRRADGQFRHNPTPDKNPAQTTSWAQINSSNTRRGRKLKKSCPPAT